MRTRYSLRMHRVLMSFFKYEALPLQYKFLVADVEHLGRGRGGLEHVHFGVAAMLDCVKVFGGGLELFGVAAMLDWVKVFRLRVEELAGVGAVVAEDVTRLHAALAVVLDVTLALSGVRARFIFWKRGRVRTCCLLRALLAPPLSETFPPDVPRVAVASAAAGRALEACGIPPQGGLVSRARLQVPDRDTRLPAAGSAPSATGNRTSR